MKYYIKDSPTGVKRYIEPIECYLTTAAETISGEVKYCGNNCCAFQVKILEGKYPAWNCTACNSEFREIYEERVTPDES
jgi:hypothetical protein